MPTMLSVQEMPEMLVALNQLLSSGTVLFEAQNHLQYLKE